ncbi:MAG: hypothetical protein ABIA76_02350 [Candidatus Diapherotrites archaeon]
MLNKKILLIALFLVLLLPVCFAEMEVKRTVKGNAEPGKTINIEININLNGEEPSSLIVTEDIPTGWELVSSTPNAVSFENKIKWLLYGNKLQNITTLKYSLKAPANFSDKEALSGNWKTLEETWPIAGDLFISKAVPEPEPTPPPQPPTEPEPIQEDYTMYIIGGLVLVIIIIGALFVMKKK